MVRQPCVCYTYHSLIPKARGLHWLAHRCYGPFDADETKDGNLFDQPAFVAVHAANDRTTHDDTLHATANYR